MKDKVVLVTGAAQGIGCAVSRALAEQGAVVVLADHNEAVLHELEDGLAADGLSGVPLVMNVSDSRAVNDTVERVERETGPIHSLVNVAGVLRTGLIASYSDEDWAATFAVNTTGVFNVSRAVLRHMIPRRSGSIVTVSSNAAGVPRMQMAAYAASKAAATHFTKCLGLEAAGYGIRCNVVSPGSTDTPMLKGLWADTAGDAKQAIAGSLESYRTGIPLQRIGAPADIAGAVLFLLSDSARHITMEDLRVDGGATLGI
ncbi:2,3-dihydro-2,3-dihydroxybenzoate dehydrogenase [Paenibacillus sambharensis]|uniref:2,3-dihydro-2,3-dihydroxybenzoate dehydrogenase n=1 Tax=Paenibacillus sambharensis TaxID=1803190 RepID=A0A2W1LLF4_9BACL|nr:2,3-dihydro-2,3-dihydroxybenzoate dehydrogenase [Paenibacillus sambharensis]